MGDRLGKGNSRHYTLEQTFVISIAVDLIEMGLPRMRAVDRAERLRLEDVLNYGTVGFLADSEDRPSLVRGEQAVLRALAKGENMLLLKLKPLFDRMLLKLEEAAKVPRGRRPKSRIPSRTQSARTGGD